MYTQTHNTCTSRLRHNVHVCIYMYMYVTSEYGDGGGLASSIVAQEGSDLTLIHVQIQLINCQLCTFPQC